MHFCSLTDLAAEKDIEWLEKQLEAIVRRANYGLTQQPVTNKEASLFQKRMAKKWLKLIKDE